MLTKVDETKQVTDLDPVLDSKIKELVLVISRKATVADRTFIKPMREQGFDDDMLELLANVTILEALKEFSLTLR